MSATSVTYNPGDILRETTKELYEILGDELEAIAVERTFIGLFFTGVKLENGAGGLCFTPIKIIPEAPCCAGSASKVVSAAGELKSRKVGQFLDEMFSGSPINKTMGIAVLNALSAMCWRKGTFRAYEMRTGVDALDAAMISDNANVVVVGTLIPTLMALMKRGKPFCILESNPSALKANEMEFYIPMEQAPDVVPKADVLIIDGTTLINDTLEGLLAMKQPGARAVVIGSTASMLPDAFLRRGVNIVGGTMLIDVDRVFNTIAEAGSEYHFVGKGAEKVVVEPKLK